MAFQGMHGGAWAEAAPGEAAAAAAAVGDKAAAAH